MGGNLALNYALRHHAEPSPTVELAGLVLAAPMLLPPRPPPRPQIFAAWLTGHLLPWLRVHSKVDASRLTSDPQQAESITDDNKMHGSISVYLATQLLSQGRWAMDHARELSIPTLLMYGDEDDLIDRAACEHLPIRAGHVVDTDVLPGKRHAIFHDQPDREVSRRLIDWLQQLGEQD